MHTSYLLAASAVLGLGAIQVVSAQEGTTPTGGNQPLATYSCDVNTCKPPLCFCASTKPPQGLDPKKIPQFVTLTFDDAINAPVLPVIMNLTSGFKPNPNGCPHSSTFFVSNQFSDYWFVQKIYSLGHEIAVHTVNHIGNPPVEEIRASQQALNAFAGIPLHKLVGFRHPFLNYSGQSFQSLASLGTFLYDSSMPHDASKAPFWPYTLDNGPAANCVSGTCDGAFKFPGLWEVPLYTLMNADGTENTPMDPNAVPGGTPGLPTAQEIVGLLKQNFLSHYNGDRVPFGMYIHAATQLSQPQRLGAFIEFIQWVKNTYPDDVYFVNNQQLLSWMLNPTDIATSKNSPTLGCNLPAQSPSSPEVCDGLDNKGNGQVDAGLVENCAFPPNTYFSTCFGCPTKIPNITEAVPPRTQNRAFIPNDGCPNGGVWDPTGAKCVEVTRTGSAPTPAANLPTPAGPGKFTPGTPPVIPPPSSPGKSGSSKNEGSKLDGGIITLIAAIAGGLFALVI
ncbi:uncharacterized protein SPPG_07135 [Spizellomyces punctatus DAOM BR117]|uniref:NodB homology domain-containing protein n=1 Tax=Spizellomyces punctatus (strain DAOM BR117) TaxID=645134 RepID=A0A0L0HAF3_SPIPD|nr:uncharacterized protein SPPG_07135 [Spizellomyces punctatus DAOM BR117]KNC97668.1 hypothetical protein SPPG_07135 [Spizellomyces punctatus DAOM BR117]|eukprot:XP_016605708.1 hypothetical protein SPPG_07135 [Spizellomyces punctatus DAOM BR117]